MKFIDQTEVHVTAGDGGDGMMSFRTARNMPKLGPDGGNGGNGGDVYLVADPSLNTLSNLRYRQVYRSDNGGKGAVNNKTGRCGKKKLIKVACGTLILDRETGEKIGELVVPGEQLLVAKGGKRGYGNLNYACSTNRTPYLFTHGQKGEHRTLSLELKLLADVGLAGFPNAGKSTLLSVLSAAKPKIADYPFTTLIPKLGVVDSGDDGEQSFVLADIPGLVEGASLGKGLGLDFLKHLERTKALVYLIDPFDLTGISALDALRKLEHEIEHFSADMAKKPKMVVLNKADLKDSFAESDVIKLQQELESNGVEFLWISAVGGQAISELKRKIFNLLESCVAEPEPEPKAVDCRISMTPNLELSAE